MSLWHCNFGPHTKSLSPVCPGLCCFCQCFRALNDDLGRKCRGVKLEAFSPPSKSMQRKSHHKDTHRMKNYVSSFTVSTVSTVYHGLFWLNLLLHLFTSFLSKSHESDCNKHKLHLSQSLLWTHVFAVAACEGSNKNNKQRHKTIWNLPPKTLQICDFNFNPSLKSVGEATKNVWICI